MQQIQLQWSDVKYTITKTKGPPCKRRETVKEILHSIAGVVEPGGMLAIVGPSGSGKTSLLNVLSGVIPRTRWEGTVNVNGTPTTRKLLQASSGFVPQDDILPGALTVFEALMFYATLKLPGVALSEKKKRVEDLIIELGLAKVRNSLVGFVGADAANTGLKRGLSGGERKRLSIGQQLITDPPLLFLDEPTTGLDSFAAESVVHTLHQQAKLGRTILFTIHQPSTEIFSKLDKLLILAHGRTMYFGPANKAIEYFGSVGYKCPKDDNPGEYFVEIIHRDPKKKYLTEENEEINKSLEQQVEGFDKSHKRAETLATKYLNSPFAEYSTKAEQTSIGSLQNNDRAKAGIITQIGALIKRNWSGLIRDVSAFRAGLLQQIVISVIMGAVYWDLGHDQKSLQDRAGGMFFGLIFLMFGGLLGPFQLFVAERKEFLFQYREGLYGTGPYYFAKILPQLPLMVIQTCVFAVIFYFMLNLRHEAAQYFFIFLAIAVLIVWTSFSFTMFLVGLFPDTNVALALFPIFFLPLMLFSGFYLNSDSTPVYFIWIEYISFMKYGFRAAIRNEMEGAVFYCRPVELVSGVCQYTVGDQWLQFRGLDNAQIWADILVLIAMIIIFNILGYLLLKRIAWASKQ